MKCPYCGATINDDSKFCMNCGKEIIRFLKCPKCKHENSLEAKFCEKCGQPLTVEPKKEQPTKEAEPKSKKEKKNPFPVLVTVVSFLLCLCMLLVNFSIFLPFSSDSFYPSSDFTIIVHASNAFEYMNDLSNNYQYFVVVTAFISIFSLTATFIVSTVCFIKSLILTIKSIGKVELFENNSKVLSKRLLSVYVLYAILFIFFRKFVMAYELCLDSSANGWQVFLLILIPLSLIGNMILNLFINNDGNLNYIIKESVFRLCAFIVLFVMFFNVGNKTFDVIGYVLQTRVVGGETVVYTSTFSSSSNALGLISSLLSNSSNIKDPAVDIIVNIITYGIVSSIVEIALMFFVILLIEQLFKNSVTSPMKYVLGIVLSGIMIGLVLSNLGMLSRINTDLETLKTVDVNLYGIAIKRNKVIFTSEVTLLICSILLLGGYIAGIVVESTFKRGNK